MNTTSFESYRQSLVSTIQHARSMEELRTALTEAQWNLEAGITDETSDDTMLEIMRLSEADAEAGRVFSMDDVERATDQTIYGFNVCKECALG